LVAEVCNAGAEKSLIVKQREAEKTRADEAEKKLKEKDEAEKKVAEEKLKEEGKLKELLEAKEGELSTISTERETLSVQVKAYEEAAQSQIASALEEIKDEEKKKSALTLLEGLSIVEQQKKLPGILNLIGQSKAGFGNSTPPGKGGGSTDVDQKKARFKELTEKATKGEQLTGSERLEKQKLSVELHDVFQKEQEAKKSET